MTARIPDGRKPLTLRQRQVITLVSAGHTNPQIAASLGIAVTSVKTHLQLVKAKLGAANRWQAVRLAWEAGELW